MNLTCTTNTVATNCTHLQPYQVSLYCTWLVGKDAPEDTQYFLYYRLVPIFTYANGLLPPVGKNLQVFQFRYGSQTEECQEYRQDTLKRKSACWFPRAFIHSKGRDWLAVHVNGSSKHSAIKPFDQLFALHAIGKMESKLKNPLPKPSIGEHYRGHRA